jgi:hypothetical protein
VCQVVDEPAPVSFLNSSGVIGSAVSQIEPVFGSFALTERNIEQHAVAIDRVAPRPRVNRSGVRTTPGYTMSWDLTPLLRAKVAAFSAGWIAPLDRAGLPVRPDIRSGIHAFAQVLGSS